MSDNDNDNSRNQHRPFWEKACEDFKEHLTARALKLTNGKVYDAEDLVQGTICRILTYPRNPEKIENPLGYLLTIMRRIWITMWHKKGKANIVSLDELKEAQPQRYRSIEPAVGPEALQILENNERREKMRAKQGPLTPRETHLLELYLKDYTCKEIADKLNEDVHAIRSDLNALRTKICSRVIKALKRE